MNIGLPSCCPVCGGKVEVIESKDGVKDLFCMNPDCPAKTNSMITAFMERLGVLGVSNASLMDWNIHNLKNLVEFKPESKNQYKMMEELDTKLWKVSRKDVFIAMSAFVPGIGKKEMEKFWDKYGGEKIFTSGFHVESSSYVKEQAILDSISKIQDNCFIIFRDSRYVEPNKGEDQEVQEAVIGTICFTGKLETMTRSEAQAKAKSYGYVIADGVSKNLTVLVVADAALEGAPSSKLKKARSLGVKIMGESEFNKMVA